MPTWGSHIPKILPPVCETRWLLAATLLLLHTHHRLPPPARAVLTELAGSGAIDLGVHAGDISYADNRGTSSRDGGYENVQNTYWNEVSPYLSHVPGMYSSGNHGAQQQQLRLRMRRE